MRRVYLLLQDIFVETEKKGLVKDASPSTSRSSEKTIGKIGSFR